MLEMFSMLRQVQYSVADKTGRRFLSSSEQKNTNGDQLLFRQAPFFIPVLFDEFAKKAIIRIVALYPDLLPEICDKVRGRLVHGHKIS